MSSVPAFVPDEVLLSDRLIGRPARPRDLEAEIRALRGLARQIAADPRLVLKRIAEVIPQLCGADSAAAGVLEQSGSHRSLRWHAASGQFATQLGRTVPTESSPIVAVAGPNQVLLFSKAEGCFPSLEHIEPAIYENLLTSWETKGRVVGVLWAISHRPEHRFDAEDARLLRTLSSFAGAAWSLIERTRATEELRAQRLAALNLMEDAVQSRHALARSEERLRLIVDNARDFAIFSLDLQRHVTSWNPGAERILGYTAGEILGRSADIIFTPEDRAAGACEREARTALTEGRAMDERWHLRKDGSRFWGNGALMTMHGPHEESIGFVKIFRDETESKLAEEALRRNRAELQAALIEAEEARRQAEEARRQAEEARRQAEDASRAKDLFLATLSHELRTPLTPVLMATETLLRRKDLPEPIREALEMISRNVQIETRFVDDLLDLTRIAHGKRELVRAPLNVHDAVRKAAEIVEPDLRGKTQRLDLQLTAQRAHLEGDALKLQQAFWNLLQNASKFTPAGGSIRIQSRNDGESSLVLDVTDTGRGINPDALPFIFEAFRQADETVAREFGGLGLGLAIVKATVEGHDGTVTASSPGPGQGSTFRVTLPLSASDPNRR